MFKTWNALDRWFDRATKPFLDYATAQREAFPPPASVGLSDGRGTKDTLPSTEGPNLTALAAAPPASNPLYQPPTTVPEGNYEAWAPDPLIVLGWAEILAEPSPIIDEQPVARAHRILFRAHTKGIF